MCFSKITITVFVQRMKYENCFKDMFESLPDYTKKVLLMFLFKNDSDLINECGFLKNIIIV